MINLTTPALRPIGVLLTTALLFMAVVSNARASDPDPFYGVMSQKNLSEDEWDTMEWGRLGSFRMPVDWKVSAPGADGRFRWDYIDAAVKSTASRGIDLLPVIYGTPKWLTTDSRRLPVWGKRPVRAWKRFLRAAVLRYGTDGSFWVRNPEIPYHPVDRWQIWNEPNIRYWAFPVSPKRYARLLKVSARVIRNYDPEAKVVTAGFYARPPKGKGIRAGAYLKRMYRVKGVRSSFDIAAIHPYASSTRQALGRTYPVRRVMNRSGNRNRRLIITELGWGSDSATAFGMGSRELQAQQLGSAFRAFLKHRSRLKLDAVYWFAWDDVPAGSKTCAFCFETGLFDHKGEAKAAWFRLLDFTHDI